MADRCEPGGDAVPREILDEITDRLQKLGGGDSSTPKSDEEDLAKILASFEESLMRLNRELEREASVKMKAVRVEYEETREVVSDLNDQLDDVVKENIGRDGAFRT